MNNGIGSLQGMSTCIGLKHLPEYRIPLHNYVSCTTVLWNFTWMCKCHLLLELGRTRITPTVHQYATEEGVHCNGVSNA